MNLNANKTLNEDTTLSNTRIDRSLPEFQSLKELAHRFCLSFGPEASVKSREAIVTIHQEAIKYVNESADRQTGSKAPSNISFLDVVTEFSSRLTVQDKKSILAELDKAFAKRANKIEANNWLPYYAYRISLMEDYVSPPLSSNVSVSSEQQTASRSEATKNNSSHLMPPPLMSDSSLGKANPRKRKQNSK